MTDSHSATRPVAIITGGSQGLGLALGEALADEGWTLVIDARRGDRLGAAAARLAARTTVIAIAGDVTDPEHRRALADAANELGPVRLLVNNASTLGTSPLRRLSEISAETMARVFDVNVVAPITLVQALGPQFTDGATVINITSDAAVEPYEGWGGYGSTKAALEQLSAILAIEHPELRVYAVDPGDMGTSTYQEA